MVPIWVWWGFGVLIWVVGGLGWFRFGLLEVWDISDLGLVRAWGGGDGGILLADKFSDSVCSGFFK